MNYQSFERPLIDIIKGAFKEIMSVYLNSEAFSEVEVKDDNSPLTLADKRSNEFIIGELRELSDYPILSEESKMLPYSERQNWKNFWLVDPLDGTKEFIKRNGEFTVNIALIEEGIPTMGIIGVPVEERIYLGYNNTAYRIENGKQEQIKVNNKLSGRTAVKSRTHSSDAEDEVLKKFDVVDSISVGSSLKLCMVAEGKADIYYRHGPTMEWDIAAGHAILRAAGGEIYSGNDLENHFTYNKEDLRNGSFLCVGFENE